MQASMEDDGGGGGMSMQVQESSGGMSMQVASSSTAAASSPSESDTAFRRAERLYKPVAPPAQNRFSRRRRARLSPSGLDEEWPRWRATTLDVRNLDRNTPENRARIITHERHDVTAGVNACECTATASTSSSSLPPSLPAWVSPRARLYSFVDLPGFYLLEGALDETAQAWWAWHSLANYSRAEHTNLTNLDQLMKQQQQQQAAAVDGVTATPEAEAPKESIWSAACASGDFSSLSKLRWSSLGYHYDWTAREYTAERRSPFPSELARLSSEIATAAGFTSLHAEAAIVNYYPSSGVMGAHVDDAELTKLQPIVSVSLGCTAIFLIGGRTKDLPPTGLLLRSGDAVIMGGESRVCFHAVPRVMDESFDFAGGDQDEVKIDATGEPASETSPDKRQKQEHAPSHTTDSALSSPSTENTAAAASAEWTPERAYAALRFQSSPSSSAASVSFPSCIGTTVPSRVDLLHTLRFLRHARLNLNVRQVEDASFRYRDGLTTALCRTMDLEQQQMQQRRQQEEASERKQNNDDDEHANEDGMHAHARAVAS